MVDFATLKLVGDTSGLKPVEPALDAVVAKAGKAEVAVKKLGTSTTTMGAGAKKAATDTRAVSTALDGIEADARQAAAALQQTEAALNKVGMQSNVAGGAVGNLSAQVFDIGMMMQAGQNPFQLMVQQGSQVAQVMGPMGAAGAVAALKATFVQLLSPVNLAVFAIIGGTAALVQWATAAGDAGSETQTFADQISKLHESIEALRGVTDLYSVEGLQTLKERYGEVTVEVLRLLEAQRAQALFQSQQDAAAAISALVDQYGLLAINLDAVGLAAKQPGLALYDLSQQLGMTVPQTRELVAAFQELDSAPLEDKPAILSEIRLQLEGATGDTQAWEVAVTQAEDAIRQANAEGARASGWLATATAGAQNWATALWGAAKAAAAARSASFTPGTFTPGGMDAAKSRATGGSGSIQPSGAGLPAVPSAGGGGGGGGGGGSRSAAASEAEKEAEAIQKVVDKLKAEIGMIGQSEAARRLHQEIQSAGVTIYSAEGQAIAQLVEDLTLLEAQQKLVEETMQGIESAAEGFFVGVLSGAKDAKDAIGDLAKQLGDLFLNQAFQMLWNGKAGGAGGLAGFFENLFMDTGGRIPAGGFGIVAEKRPELVNGMLVAGPSLIRGPADVTGGAATAKMMAAPAMQVASLSRRSSPMQPKVSVAPTPVQVVVLKDPREIDAWLRSPEGERAAAWQNRRRGNG